MRLLVFIILLFTAGCSPPMPPTTSQNSGIQQSHSHSQTQGRAQPTTTVNNTNSDFSIKIVDNIPIENLEEFLYRSFDKQKTYQSNVVYTFNFLSGTSLEIEAFESKANYHSVSKYNISPTWKRELVGTNGNRLINEVSREDGERFPIIIVQNGDDEIQYIDIGGIRWRKRLSSSSKNSNNNSRIHTVREGENLKFIANKYGMTLEEILNLNSYLKSRRNKIEIDERIRVR